MEEGHQKWSQPLMVRSPELVRKHQYVFLSCVHLISLFKRKIADLSHRGPRQKEGALGHTHTQYCDLLQCKPSGDEFFMMAAGAEMAS